MSGSTALDFAVFKGFPEVVVTLLAHGADPNRNMVGRGGRYGLGRGGLGEVIIASCFLWTLWMLHQADGSTPLCTASARGFTEVVNALVSSQGPIHCNVDKPAVSRCALKFYLFLQFHVRGSAALLPPTCPSLPIPSLHPTWCERRGSAAPRCTWRARRATLGLWPACWITARHQMWLK